MMETMTRGGELLTVYQKQLRSVVGKTTIPAWLKGSIGVCVHGEERLALYHNMLAKNRTIDLCVLLSNSEKLRKSMK